MQGTPAVVVVNYALGLAAYKRALFSSSLLSEMFGDFIHDDRARRLTERNSFAGRRAKVVYRSEYGNVLGALLCRISPQRKFSTGIHNQIYIS